MPYLGIGSLSGIIHVIARLPHAARAVVLVAVLIPIWRGTEGEARCQIPRCGRTCARRLRR
jgi:hypothetical protein